MMKLHKQISEIAEQLKKETAGQKVAYLTSNKEDLYEMDRDILNNDSQEGDTYVWALKSNGCGTFIVRCQGEQESYTLKGAGKDSKFFLLRCTGVNEGSVQEISFEQALSANKDYPEPLGRIPRRRRLYDQLNDILGLDQSTGRLEAGRMGSEFSPRDGDISVIKISKSQNNWMALQVVRPKITPPGEFEVLCQKPNETYYATITSSTDDSLMNAPTYLLIESQADGFAKVSEATQRMFTIANRTIENNTKIEDESQLSS